MRHPNEWTIEELRGAWEDLARNLMNAFMAHRLGTTVATQERNNRSMQAKDLGDLWFWMAVWMEYQHVQGMEELFKRMTPSPGKIQ